MQARRAHCAKILAFLPPHGTWAVGMLLHPAALFRSVGSFGAVSLVVVPTISFQLLYGLLILAHDRRR
jgi:hypothetical protein